MALLPQRAIVVMGKAPVPGTVKTRLVPPLDTEQAAQLYGAFLQDTLLTARAVPNAAVYLSHPPADDPSTLRKLVPVGVCCIEDMKTDLGDSMDHAFRHCFERDAASVVLIGSDLPTLPADHIELAFDHLEQAVSDVVLGPAVDGGYYLIGLRAAQRILFTNMVWSTSRVLEQTLVRARRAGLRTVLLKPWRDVDLPSDLEALRRELAHDSTLAAPTTRQVLTTIWPDVARTHDLH